MKFLTLFVLWGSLVFGQGPIPPDPQRIPERAPKTETTHPHSPVLVHKRTFNKTELRSFNVDLSTHKLTLEIQTTEPAGRVSSRAKYLLDPVECSLVNQKTRQKSFFEPPVGQSFDQAFDIILAVSLGLTLAAEEGKGSPVPLLPIKQTVETPVRAKK